MNSRQRRQFKRRWKHVVVIAPTNLGYDEFYGDNGPIAWLNRNYGYDKYQTDDGYCSVKFDDKEKAMQFALMWSGT